MFARLLPPLLCSTVLSMACQSVDDPSFRSKPQHHHDDDDDDDDGDGCDVLDVSDLLARYDADTDPYADPNLWLAGPDAAEDFVLSVDLSTTIVHPDLRTEVVVPERPEDPDLDIFYLHPTVDLTALAPGNHDLVDRTNIEQFTTETVAPLSSKGRVVAPLYHSANALVFLPELRPVRDLYLEVAYADVEAAFLHYLANHWDGRKLMIVGYSQGAILTRWLFERLIGDHPDLMRRVVMVAAIGGDMQTDSLPDLPICTRKQQTGCMIAYNSYYAGTAPSDEPPTTFGEWVGTPTTVCTSVADALHPHGEVYASSIFKVPRTFNEIIYSALEPIPIEIETNFMAFPEFYAARCVDQGGVWLEVSEADEVDPEDERRWSPIDYDHAFLSTAPPFGSGLHQYDYALALGDLLALTEYKAARLDDESEFCVSP